MNVEQVIVPIIRQIGARPRLSKQLFRFAKWGDPFTPRRFSWPYPIYDKMTAGGPVVYSRPYQQWFVSGHDEVLQILRSPDVSTAALGRRILSVSPYSKLSDVTVENFTRWLLINDPPDHTRLRGSVVRAFTPRRIAGYEGRVREITAELLDEMSDDDRVDVVARFTSLLPIYVIAELLGLPRDRRTWLRDASHAISGMLEPMHLIDAEETDRWFRDIRDTFVALIAERRADPRDDLISALANDEDEQLDDDELVAMISVLMFAGHETTTGQLGNSIVALAEHPDQRDLLGSSPDLIENAVEELLRYDTTAQFTGRSSTSAIEVGGLTIPAGASIALMIGAANRDPRVWSDGDQLRVDRENPRPISFGQGIHHCLGAALARLELRVALPAFLESFGEYTVDHDTAEWRLSHTLRGPTRLHVTRG